MNERTHFTISTILNSARVKETPDADSLAPVAGRGTPYAGYSHLFPWDTGKRKGVGELRTRFKLPCAVREGFLQEGIPTLCPEREVEVRQANRTREMRPGHM